MRRASLVLIVTVTMVSGTWLAAQRPAEAVTVYKDPTCGCCAKWVEHLEQQGFATKTIEVADIEEVKTKNNVPRQARSCHTALVRGYVIEGHVPAVDIQRLLKERPAGIVGLAVPGMPIGSPGMEMQGVKAQPYDVIAFDRDGRSSVFVSHGH